MAGTVDTPLKGQPVGPEGAAPDAPADPARPWLVTHRRAIVGAAALAVIAPLVGYVATRPIGGGTSTGSEVQTSGSLLGKPAPAFTLKNPSGKTVSLQQLRGKPVIVNFWATWCAPCREEMPELEQLYREYQDKGLVVLGVSVDDSSSAKQVPELLKEGNPAVGSYTFPVALDQNQEVLRQYHVVGVPSSFFVDAKGTVRAIQPRAMDHKTMLDSLRTIMPGV